MPRPIGLTPMASPTGIADAGGQCQRRGDASETGRQVMPERPSTYPTVETAMAFCRTACGDGRKEETGETIGANAATTMPREGGRW